MRRVLLAGPLLLVIALVACGHDADEARTIGLLRTSSIAAEDQEAVCAEEELADAVEELVADGADLLVALSTTAAKAAMAGAEDVPILVLANDPVASGLVVEPRAPTGSVTGIAFRVPADRTI